MNCLKNAIPPWWKQDNYYYLQNDYIADTRFSSCKISKLIGKIWYYDIQQSVLKYSVATQLMPHSWFLWCRLMWGWFVDACVFVLVHVTVPYPEVLDVIVETLQSVFTKGVCSSTLTWPLATMGLMPHRRLLFHPRMPGAPPVQLPHPKYGCTEMDPPQSFEPLQAQRVMI